MMQMISELRLQTTYIQNVIVTCYLLLKHDHTTCLFLLLFNVLRLSGIFYNLIAILFFFLEPFWKLQASRYFIIKAN